MPWNETAGTCDDLHLSPADFHSAYINDTVIGMEGPVRPFKRLLNPQNFLNPVIDHNIMWIESAGIAYNT